MKVTDLDVRPEVARFALAMEAKLRKHDAKHGGRKGWLTNTIANLYRWMLAETIEVRDAIEAGTDLGEECADVANLAMMIADRAGHLPELRVDNDKPVAWLIVRPDTVGKGERLEVVLSPLTDETFMDEGDEAWPLYRRVK